MAAGSEANKAKSIEISAEWEAELKALPFLSQKSGKTIHLLKARSKKIQSGRKRRKVETLGTFADYKESKKKPAMAELQPPVPNQMPPPHVQPPKPASGSIQQLLAGAAANLKKDANMGGK